MGHDPSSDWLTPPFHRGRNALRVAARAALGAVDRERMDFESEVEAPVGEFYADLTDAMEVVHSWQRTTCEQGLCGESRSIPRRSRGSTTRSTSADRSLSTGIDHEPPD